jgi:ethanolamine utilization protein EutM
MPQLSLGTIEVLGLPAAVEAADVALKTADVKLIGYETTDGMGMVAVKIEGQVSAVQAAVAAASAAAARVSKVFATSIIARPSDQVESVVYTAETVGLAKPKPATPVVAPKPRPVAEPEPKPVVEPEPVVEAEPAVEPEPVVVPEPAVEPEPAPVAETLVEPDAKPKPRTTTRTRSAKK